MNVCVRTCMTGARVTACIHVFKRSFECACYGMHAYLRVVRVLCIFIRGVCVYSYMLLCVRGRATACIRTDSQAVLGSNRSSN